MSKHRACDDYWPASTVGIGAAHQLTERGDGEVAGVLWVPDPEQRHGWRESYVVKPPKLRRPVGFHPK